jgi:hypothetical protein
MPKKILSPAYQELLIKGRAIVQPLNAPTRIRFYKELGWACVMVVSFLVLSLAVQHLAFGSAEDIDFWQSVKQQQ